MKPNLPEPSQCLHAIQLYLSLAYDSDPSTTVLSQVETLRSWPGGIYDSPIFARIGHPIVQRYSIRLGNRFYPHMKFVLELAPGGQQYLFRADTHDRHVCPPPGSKEHVAFCELMKKNQAIAEKIEAAWAEAGLPTFKTFLKDDLARRTSEGQ
ncbi:MAG: hypothetical protein NZ561_04000 [Phycisphaerae bacterium]|nr:hypothetical protein [Phycisphaerae bacterium]MDW8261733.1 hypothetical protein [Phycisphaerales bacterium]